MASLYKKRGKWHIDYWVSGKRHTKNTGIKANYETKKKAVRIKQEIEYALSSPGMIDDHSKTQTLEEAYRFCLSNKFNPSIYSKSHIDQFKIAMKRFTNVIDKNKSIQDITRSEISRFIATVKPEIANATLHTYIRYLKIFFNFLVDEELIRKTPISRKLIPKRERNAIIVFTNNEVDLILKESIDRDENLYDIFMLLLLTGLRPIDLMNLKSEDFNLEKRTILVRVSKSSKEILFPIYNELEEFVKLRLIKKIQSSKGLLFNGYSVEKVGDRFQEIKEKLEIPKNYKYTLKTFRKTFATRMASLGVPIFDVANLLGHDSIKTTTQYYTEADMESLRNRINQKLAE